MDLNEMARHHSAGAIVRHHTPFESLHSHQNEGQLSVDFVKQWARPFYMNIGSVADFAWIEQIKAVKHEITVDVCLSLLGDFNWRTRIVGAYFAAVKNFKELTDIIGVHFLKSELCCAGHIYALTLAFFNTEKSTYYLNTYLDYYLTTPALYFDQEHAMTAVLYLDKENGTAMFKKHLDNWHQLQVNRRPGEQESTHKIAKILEELEGKEKANEFLQSQSVSNDQYTTDFDTDYFRKQMAILKELAQ